MLTLSERAEVRAKGAASLKLQREIKTACADIRRTMRKTGAAEWDCVLLLKRIPGIGRDTAFRMIAERVGDCIHKPTDPLQLRFERILTASERKLAETPNLGPTKAKVLYDALTLARFDLLTDRIADSLKRHPSVAGRKIKPEDREEAIEELSVLAHLLRTGKWPE